MVITTIFKSFPTNIGIKGPLITFDRTFLGTKTKLYVSAYVSVQPRSNPLAKSQNQQSNSCSVFSSFRERCVVEKVEGNWKLRKR
jgi:hypothetical protein